MLVGILDKVGSSEVVTGSPSGQHCPEGRILWVLEGAAALPQFQGENGQNRGWNWLALGTRDLDSRKGNLKPTLTNS